MLSSRLLPLLAALLLSGFGVRAQSPPPAATLEPVAEFGRHQPIGVAVSRTQRVFVTFPKKDKDYDYGLTELIQGQRRPFPDAAWNQWDSTKAASRWVNVQALFVDRNDHLWVLDPANPGDEAPVKAGVKLVHINLATNKVERIYRFEDLPLERSGLNDVRVDTEQQLAYLSDPKLAALVVLDLRTGRSRLVLQGHTSVLAAPGFVLRIDGRQVKDKQGKAFSSNVNGIALTPDFRFLYYRAINQTKLYRIATTALRDPALTPAQVAAQVEEVGEVGISHGMLTDLAGNVYLTDSPNHAVRRVTPAGRLETVVRDARLLWPDSFGLSPDGYLYVTAAQIERTPKWNNGQNRVEYPFWLYRVRVQ